MEFPLDVDGFLRRECPSCREQFKGSPDTSVGHLRPGRAGRWPPRLSMASAISASGERNPNATRVMSRILVLTDSMRPLDRTVECA